MKKDAEAQSAIHFFAYFRSHLYIEGQVMVVGHKVKALQLEVPSGRTIDPSDYSVEELQPAARGRHFWFGIPLLSSGSPGYTRRR